MAQTCVSPTTPQKAARAAAMFLAYSALLTLGPVFAFFSVPLSCIAVLLKAVRLNQALASIRKRLCSPSAVPARRMAYPRKITFRIRRTGLKCKSPRVPVNLASIATSASSRSSCTDSACPSPTPSLPADALCSLQLPGPLVGAEALQCKQGTTSSSSSSSDSSSDSSSWGSWVARKLFCCSAPASSHTSTITASTISTDIGSSSALNSVASASQAPSSSPSASTTTTTCCSSCPSSTSGTRTTPTSSTSASSTTPSPLLPSASFGPLPPPPCSSLLDGVDQESLLAQLAQQGAGAAAAAGGYGVFYPACVAGQLLGLKALLPFTPAALSSFSCCSSADTSTSADLATAPLNLTTEEDLQWEVGCHAAAQAASPLVVRLHHAHLGRGSSTTTTNSSSTINSSAADDSSTTTTTTTSPGGLLWQELGLLSCSDLCKKLRRGQATLSTAQLRHITACLLAAVQQLWESGVAHGDVKPSNLLLVGPNLTPKLCDFGMARLRHPRTGEWAGNFAWGGTPWYLPFEAQQQRKSPRLGLASELYGVAATVLELALAGAKIPMTDSLFLDLMVGAFDWDTYGPLCPALNTEDGEYLASLLMGLTSTCPATRIDAAARCAGHACFDPCDDGASPYPGLLQHHDGQGLAALPMPDIASLLGGEEPGAGYEALRHAAGTLQL